MGRTISAEQDASPVGRGTSALQGACAREKGACAGACDGASGVAGGSSVLVNAAPEGGACVAAFGPLEEAGDTAAADGLPGTSRSAPVVVGREEGQIQDSVEDSLRRPSGLVDHWGVLGRNGGLRWRVKAEEVPSRLGG